ncbi:MAG: CDP-alcohol phosphatidyltransferase family protein [Anaerolineae bacterium]|nr:CDP-alcohol phosphatidyltransferase family protein [Anaerolineae bacterium]
MANAITLLRIPLLVGIILLLYFGGTGARFACVPLLVFLILMDTLDGIVARRRRESSLLGSTLDIAVDRAVEIVLWVTFADLDLIPLAIPVIVIIRGALVDAFRSVGVQAGVKPFDMVRAGWARKLVASPALRTPYGVVKGVAFSLLAFTLAMQGTANVAGARWAWLLAQVASWLAVALCLVRGIPVLVDSWSLLSARQRDDASS